MDPACPMCNSPFATLLEETKYKYYYRCRDCGWTYQESK